jgi:hypothetical protein
LPASPLASAPSSTGGTVATTTTVTSSITELSGFIDFSIVI